MLTRRAVLVAAAALPAACAASPVFRIGFQNNGLLLAAKARGAIEAALHGRAKVTWSDYPSGPPLLEAMGIGGLEFGGAGDTPPIFAQAAGARIVYVAAQPVSGRAAAIVVPATSRRTADDLRGAKLAYTRGSSAQNFIIAALARHGLTMADVQPLNLTPVQAAQAFAARAVDAWAIWDPFLARAEVELGARVVVSGEGLARSTSFLLANAGLVATAPGLVTATLDALAATAAWAATHRGDLATLIARATALDAAVAARIAARQDLAIEPLTAVIASEQQRLADELRRSGALPDAVNVAAAMWRGWRR